MIEEGEDNVLEFSSVLISIPYGRPALPICILLKTVHWLGLGRPGS